MTLFCNPKAIASFTLNKLDSIGCFKTSSCSSTVCTCSLVLNPRSQVKSRVPLVIFSNERKSDFSN